MDFRRLLFSLFFPGILISIFGHGLIETPPSRSWICGAVTKPDEIAQGRAEFPVCSTAFAQDPMAAYNYMAVLSHTLGRADVSPLPENVCGFDSESWNGETTIWDVPMDWPANEMSSGTQDFTWNITWGPHFDDTFEFRYWITKSDFIFSKDRALSWDDFETEAFCVQNYDDTNPNGNPDVLVDKTSSHFTTRCELPERTGHHVIYAEWGRSGPTFERFHGCVDAAFGAVGLKDFPYLRGSPKAKYNSSKSLFDIMGRSRSPESGIILLPAH